MAKELLLNPTNKAPKDFLLKSDLDTAIGQGISGGFGLDEMPQGITSFQSAFNYWNLLLYQSDRNRKLITHSKKILNSKGRESFETQTGFTITGHSFVEDVIVSNNQRDIFKENGSIQIRINDDSILSALFILKNNESIPLAVLHGYIGTLVFEKGKLLTVNYMPSKNNRKYQNFKDHEKEINFVRAFIASTANEGLDYQKIFEREFNQGGGFRYADSGSFLRREKSLDPSLGLYAVYAYRQSGKLKEIRSVYNFMRQEPGALIFDVVMLANQLKGDLDRTAPFCPMLSLGWAYKERLMKNIYPVIKEASMFLIPNLWTTFSEEGTDILKKAIQQNQLK